MRRTKAWSAEASEHPGKYGRRPATAEETTTIMKTNMVDYPRKIEDNLRELLASCQGPYISSNYVPGTQPCGGAFIRGVLAAPCPPGIQHATTTLVRQHLCILRCFHDMTTHGNTWRISLYFNEHYAYSPRVGGSRACVCVCV